MDLRQIRYFQAVVQAGSLSAASDLLRVSQPAIGMQIRNLEEEFGLKLLVRHSRGVRTTPAGDVFSTHAERILRDIQAVRTELRSFRAEDAGAVRIGLTTSLAKLLAQRLLELCAERHPELSLLLIQGLVPEIHKEWEAGNTDLTITDRDLEAEDTESLPLFRETFVLVGPAALMDPLPDPVPLQAMARLPLTYDPRNPASWQAITRALEEQEVALTDAMEVTSIFLRRAYVMQRQRCTVAPSAFFAQEIEAGACVAKAIDLPALTRIVQLAGPRVERMTAAESAARQMVVTAVDEIVERGLYGWRRVREMPGP